MVRGLLILLILSATGLVMAPLVVSSLYVDRRGITIPGKVYSKSETVSLHNTDWTRTQEVTVEFDPPDASMVEFLNVRLNPDRYDALHKGQTVSVHYLLRRDIPNLPLAHIMREMHMLRMARLADQRAFAGLSAALAGKVPLIWQYAGAILVVLLVWRLVGWPGFKWAAAAVCAAGVAGLFIADFPRPTPRPALDVRQGQGRVKSLDRIDRLFRGHRTHGMLAAQPVDVVGIEFVPPGRTEPVVAVDLIDAGSIGDLTENSIVPIEYESRAPRTAYIRAATRNFVSRNVSGVILDGILALAVLVGFIVVANWAEQAFNRLAARPRNR